MLGLVARLCDADAAATLTALAAACVASAADICPRRPARWLVSGGGARNQTLMSELRKRVDPAVHPVSNFGLDGDMIEAQAFAYLAVRSLHQLPISALSTTGVDRPLTGGQIVRFSAS